MGIFVLGAGGRLSRSGRSRRRPRRCYFEAEQPAPPASLGAALRDLLRSFGEGALPCVPPGAPATASASVWGILAPYPPKSLRQNPLDLSASSSSRILLASSWARRRSSRSLSSSPLSVDSARSVSSRRALASAASAERASRRVTRSRMVSAAEEPA